MRELLRIRDDASARELEDGRVVLDEGYFRIALGPVGAGLRSALAILGGPGATERDLASAVTQAEGEPAVLKLHMLLRRLQTGGWLERRLDEDAPLLTLRPLGHLIPSDARPPDPEQPLTLSRFAVIHTVKEELRAESPLVGVSVALHDRRLVMLLAALATPTAPNDLNGAGNGLSAPGLDAAIRILTQARVLVAAGADDAEPLAQWSFADLLFHVRSRVGRHVGGYGGTYHRRVSADPLPAVKPAPAPTVRLHRPDLDELAAHDPSYCRVIEQRRSIREHDDDHPISADQLGELLFRCARARARFRDDAQELSDRPYPGGGALYELELYPLVSLCAGIEPGLYHYDPIDHALGLVAERAATEALVDYARRAAIMTRAPQVLMLIAARFGRAMWKYESMAYALVLKDVGVMYQTLYGAATAMGLAPCGLGGGSPDAFALATGIDYYAETTVGEFVIGSRCRDATRRDLDSRGE